MYKKRKKNWKLIKRKKKMNYKNKLYKKKEWNIYLNKVIYIV